MKTMNQKSVETLDNEYQNSIIYKCVENFIREGKDYMDWGDVSRANKLSEGFIREHKDYVDWYFISACQNLSEEFLMEFKDRVSWKAVSACQKLSKEFLREFQDRVCWENISIYQNITEEFLLEFKDKVDWRYISKYQKLSENFIREFKDKIDWVLISKYQKLSEKFIWQYIDRLDLESIIKYQKISDNLMSFLKSSVPEINQLTKGSWANKSPEFKKNEIVKTGLFETHKNYFVAYKAIREDRYDFYAFQDNYEVGATVERQADCTANLYSFGLHASTEEGAIEYGAKHSGQYSNNLDFIVIKVKIRYEDLSYISLDKNNKLVRCCKMIVIS